MRLCSISSGSSGNCIYIGSDNHHLLVDAGISGKRIETGLNGIGLKTADIEGILVTHEHADHIKGLGVVSRRYGIPVYATCGTIEWIRGNHAVGDVDYSTFHEIFADDVFDIGDINILPFEISHDAAEPVSYVFRSPGKSAAVVTDLGKYDDYIVDKLQGLDVLLLEANHDVGMLKSGRYPEYLKRRILSERGHLSNELSGQLLCELLHDGMKKILLGHLSHENNYPSLAKRSVMEQITAGDVPYKGNDFPVDVAPRDMPSEYIEF